MSAETIINERYYVPVLSIYFSNRSKNLTLNLKLVKKFEILYKKVVVNCQKNKRNTNQV